MPNEKPEGGCDCGEVRYRLLASPLIVHGCHCRRCQRQTGSTHAVNALIEGSNVLLLSGNIIEDMAETPSGSGQKITRCTNCHVAVWSEYLRFAKRVPSLILFIRAGTLDQPHHLPPDVYIHTDSKQPHAILNNGVPSFGAFYDLRQVWSEESMKRLAQARHTLEPARRVS